MIHLNLNRCSLRFLHRTEKVATKSITLHWRIQRKEGTAPPPSPVQFLSFSSSFGGDLAKYKVGTHISRIGAPSGKILDPPLSYSVFSRIDQSSRNCSILHFRKIIESFNWYRSSCMKYGSLLQSTGRVSPKLGWKNNYKRTAKGKTDAWVCLQFTYHTKCRNTRNIAGTNISSEPMLHLLLNTTIPGMIPLIHVNSNISTTFLSIFETKLSTL